MLYLDLAPVLFYFNPRPPCGGRLAKYLTVFASIRISIHALRVEGDEIVAALIHGLKISIHALRVEGDSALRGS